MGESYIGVATARANAKRYGHSLKEELYRLLAHGLLHVCGYRDDSASNRQAMRKKEATYLAFSPMFHVKHLKKQTKDTQK